LVADGTGDEFTRRDSMLSRSIAHLLQQSGIAQAGQRVFRACRIGQDSEDTTEHCNLLLHQG
jgi:hypothetical protein